MIQLIKDILGIGPIADLGELIKKGAAIVDVRSKGEYAGGHVKGSVNIPLDQLEGNLNKFKNKEQVIITCCASGIRSGRAKGLLRRHGYNQVYNGGSLYNLKKYCE
jgi:phage shock protein E